MNRREFLKLAGVAGAVTIPALLGYDLVLQAKGDDLPSLSPYAPQNFMTGWPANRLQAAPILLLVNNRAANPFGIYLAEILRAEGLNCFQVASLSGLDSAPLHWYSLILLAEGPLSPSEMTLLAGYVRGGGALVAMRPNPQLAPLFGVVPAPGHTAEARLQVHPGHPAGHGITAESLQFHGEADHYQLSGAQAVAWLAGRQGSQLDYPAITLYRNGSGWAAMWAFDLARSVAYTRQGNPAWANQQRDSGDGIRATDMFTGWIDLDRLAIPQADEQQRLLVNLFAAVTPEASPIPRLWYFPNTARTMLIATGDSHGNPAAAIEDVLGRVEQRGGHMSVYYTAFPGTDIRRAAKKAAYHTANWPALETVTANLLTAPKPSSIADWRTRGHEFAIHPYVEQGLETGWRNFWEEFTGLGYGPIPPTVRTHRVQWTGWVETARIQASYGMRMNLDYYHWGPLFLNNAGNWVNGHFTGSGLPMKFIDEQGRVLNIYQQLTQLADDHLLNLHFGGVAKLSAGAAVEIFRTMAQRSLGGEYAALCAQFHVDPFAVGGQHFAEAVYWLENTLDYAVSHNIPIWSAREWLAFTEVRHDAKVEAIHWDAPAGRLSFRFATRESPAFKLAVMVPEQHGQLTLKQVQVGEQSVDFEKQRVGGIDYGLLPLAAGTHQITAYYG